MSQADLLMLVAYVRPSKRAKVAEALRNEGVLGWTESIGVGHGRAAGGREVPHIRFEIVVAAEHAPDCSDTITSAARTGSKGDGFVMTLPILASRRVGDRADGPSLLGLVAAQ